ncbi:MAG: tetratricopeptide repeat protein [Rubrobacter sp.]|nr:tetratricopeptide repeat protein [Rubrobacter sp.]
MHRHTLGNPFFTVEALRALVERGDLSRWEGRWVRKEISGIEIPESVSEAISERASRLAQGTLETLEAASVLGHAFAFEDLPGGDEDAEASLEEAIEAGLLHTEGELYAFDHPLIAQTLYAALSPARRKRLHRTAGEAMENLGERGRKRRAAEISHHFSEGGEPTRARPYALLAGEDAEAMLALAEAERHYREALRLAEETEDHTGETEASTRIGAILTLSGRCDEAVDILERAMETAAENGDREGEARAAARLGLAHFYKGGASNEFITRLRTLAEEFASSGVRAESSAALWRSLSALFFAARRYEESLEAARRTASFAREAGDGFAAVRAGMACGQALIFLRRPEEARAELEAAMELAEESDDTLNVLFGALMLDLLDTARGAFERSIEWSARGFALAERLGNKA